MDVTCSLPITSSKKPRKYRTLNSLQYPTNLPSISRILVFIFPSSSYASFFDLRFFRPNSVCKGGIIIPIFFLDRISRIPGTKINSWVLFFSLISISCYLLEFQFLELGLHSLAHSIDAIQLVKTLNWCYDGMLLRFFWRTSLCLCIILWHAIFLMEFNKFIRN